MSWTEASRLWLLGAVVVGPCFPAVSRASHQWARVFGGSGDQVPYSVQQTSDGGYVLAGYTSGSSGGDQDVWLVKLDSSGNISWQRTFAGGSGTESGGLVRQTADGGYYLACHTPAFGSSSDVWLLRLDSAGSVLWQRAYGGTNTDSVYSIEVTSDGGCVFGGDTRSFGSADTNAWMGKLTNSGTVTWAKRRYMGSGDQPNGYSQQVRTILPNGSGGYATLVDVHMPIGVEAILFQPLDSNGSISGPKHLISPGNSALPRSMDRAGDGGWFVSGISMESGNNSDGLLMKLNSTGSPVWQKHLGDQGTSYFLDGRSTPDGGYVAVGEAESPTDGSSDIWVVKFDSTGAVGWQRTYGGPSTEVGRAIGRTSDGGYIVTGESESFGGAKEVLLLRLSPTGEIDTSCGGLVETAALPSADLSASDSTSFTSSVYDTTVTAATPSYGLNNTNASSTALCTSSCQVSCTATAPASSVVGMDASFASSATLVDCGGAVSYGWDFGDGNTSSEQNPSHAYAAPGVYPWILDVTAPGASPCTQSGSITVASTAVPDLTGAWTSVTKKKSKVNATFSCQNIDLGDAGSFTIKIYSSKKPTIGKKSKLIRTQTVSSLAAGAVVPITFKTTLQNKHKYLLALVDSDGTVTEANEANNTITQALP